LKRIPDDLVYVEKFSVDDASTRDLDICSPIFPICSAQAKGLTDYLLTKGYGASPIIYPIVNSPRVRMAVHVSNTEADIDLFIEAVVEWATKHAEDVVPSVVHSESKYVETRARL
jgi:8-amino-7-oxononanoate synthase